MHHEWRAPTGPAPTPGTGTGTHRQPLVPAKSRMMPEGQPPARRPRPCPAVADQARPCKPAGDSEVPCGRLQMSRRSHLTLRLPHGAGPCWRLSRRRGRRGPGCQFPQNCGWGLGPVPNPAKPRRAEMPRRIPACPVMMPVPSASRRSPIFVLILFIAFTINLKG
jgi:hypothetical protein